MCPIFYHWLLKTKILLLHLCEKDKGWFMLISGSCNTFLLVTFCSFPPLFRHVTDPRNTILFVVSTSRHSKDSIGSVPWLLRSSGLYSFPCLCFPGDVLRPERYVSWSFPCLIVYLLKICYRWDDVGYCVLFKTRVGMEVVTLPFGSEGVNGPTVSVGCGGRPHSSGLFHSLRRITP